MKTIHKGYHTYILEDVYKLRLQMEIRRIKLNYEERIEVEDSPNYNAKDWDYWNGFISTAPVKHFIKHHYFLTWEEEILAE